MNTGLNTRLQSSKYSALAAIILISLLIYPFILILGASGLKVAAPIENISYVLLDKSKLSIAMSAVDPDIHTLSADEKNTMAVRIQVKDSDGKPVQGAEIKLEAVLEAVIEGNTVNSTTRTDAILSDNAENYGILMPNSPALEDNASRSGKTEFPIESANTSITSITSITGTTSSSFTASIDSSSSYALIASQTSASMKQVAAGSFRPASGITDASGSFMSEYSPPSSVGDATKVRLVSSLAGTEKISLVPITLMPVPVVLIHGYQASPEIFSGVSAYLKTQGFKPLGFGYQSEKGVAASSVELSRYLDTTQKELKKTGIQVSRFDLVAHSMGGLVARYYTCTSEYLSKENVRKLIFLSVPQRGSPFASLGLKYYDDKGIHDLLTDSKLYTSLLPSMINGGLNSTIQTGSIIGRYDEVVSSESASLSEWKIKTELFDVGDSNFTIDKLLSGEILQAANHKLILYNKKVYQRIMQMLVSDLPYPSAK